MTIHIDELIRSKRKTIALLINKEGKLIIKAPLNASEKFIRELVHKKKEWILRKKELVATKKKKSVLYQDGDIIKLFNQDFKIKAVANYKYAMRCVDRTIFISEELLPDIALLLPKIIKPLAEIYFKERLDYWTGKMGIEIRQLKISSAKLRWGSCSSQGNINLNWRLAMAPPDILDYIIVHELAHIKEMNHSERFWRIVAKYLPDFKKSGKWLKDYGYLLDI